MDQKNERKVGWEERGKAGKNLQSDNAPPPSLFL